jgi:predicted metal-dependent hydrolase
MPANIQIVSSKTKPVNGDHAPQLHPRSFSTSKPDIPNRHWVRQDVFATALFNAFSAVFPHGESFMVRCIKPWQNRMPEKLALDVKNFVEQESAHAREHGNMNQILIQAGYDLEPLERTIKGFVRFFRDSNEMLCLGVTMCIEHFTSIIGAEVLKNDHHLAGSDPELHELWIWHAIEEVEHKAVAFDVWQYATRDWSASRKYAVRCSLLMLITISFLINRTRGQMQLLSQDGIPARRAFRGLIALGFGRGGLARNIFRPWLSFFRPGFHPWDLDDRALLAKGELVLAGMAKTELITVKAAKAAERRGRPRLAKAA